MFIPAGLEVARPEWPPPRCGDDGKRAVSGPRGDSGVDSAHFPTLPATALVGHAPQTAAVAGPHRPRPQWSPQPLRPYPPRFAPAPAGRTDACADACPDPDRPDGRSASSTATAPSSVAHFCSLPRSAHISMVVSSLSTATPRSVSVANFHLPISTANRPSPWWNVLANPFMFIPAGLVLSVEAVDILIGEHRMLPVGWHSPDLTAHVLPPSALVSTYRVARTPHPLMTAFQSRACAGLPTSRRPALFAIGLPPADPAQ